MNTKKKLHLVSMYLAHPVLAAHQITLEMAEETTGTFVGHVRTDPNHCSLNGWGDRTGCTRIAISSHDARAVLMRTLDPTGHHRLYYQMTIGTSPVHTIHLIEYPKADLWYLVVEVPDQETAVVPLFRADLFS